MSMLPDVLGASDEATHSKKPIPKWVPVTLLAVMTASVALPVYLLKRHQTKYLSQASAPPARRNVKGQALGTRPSLLADVQRPARRPEQSTMSPRTARHHAQTELDDGFNAPLHGLKAFGIATLGVWTCAAVGVWGVKAYTGVQNMQEFNVYMRQTLLTKMPWLAARLHAPVAPDPGYNLPTPTTLTAASSDAAHPPPTNETTAPWTWSKAEQRLRTAFDERGFSGWAEAVLREMEEEARIEGIKRGFDSNADRSSRE
ncbi:hypothetical protein OE88DRAFT_399130 [Heliocybe sulcata]|uniref:Uncharacterized protein n=1 Tax=Heliocybe sulcata TaxID=5364 RepID=A0A5C3MZK4_9AGAM|nr:hypothetical protein OE88DRAFT_399130 [Heliocybe sulcata]